MIDCSFRNTAQQKDRQMQKRIDLTQFKESFREWYGSLSIEELVTNFELIEIIKKIEMNISKEESKQ